jgi:hypothetical protein
MVACLEKELLLAAPQRLISFSQNVKLDNRCLLENL